jgi:hypothetical protein
MAVPGKAHPDSLENALAECRRLREENRRLRELLAQHKIEFLVTPADWTRTLVAGKRPSSPNRLSGASSFNPEGFFHEAITNAKDLPVKTNRRIGVVNPELNLVTDLKRAIGIVELNDAMLGV